jgi:hypothetical protein
MSARITITNLADVLAGFQVTEDKIEDILSNIDKNLLDYIALHLHSDKNFYQRFLRDFSAIFPKTIVRSINKTIFTSEYNCEINTKNAAFLKGAPTYQSLIGKCIVVGPGLINFVAVAHGSPKFRVKQK